MNLHMCVEKRIQKREKEKNKDGEYGPHRMNSVIYRLRGLG